jgi:hypothetical protein
MSFPIKGVEVSRMGSAQDLSCGETKVKERERDE